MAPVVTININAKDYIRDLQQLKALIPLANATAVAHIGAGLRSIIIQSLEIALDSAPNFPAIYARHLRQGVRNTYPEVFVTSEGLVARYFSLESLADYSDLEEGFHYHAILDNGRGNFSVSNPPRLELPYVGQALANEDKASRLAYWKALVAGESTYTVTFGGGRGPNGQSTPKYTKEMPITGSYAETLRARVEWWGDRYPEWLLLEYGQDDPPETPATHFKYFTEQRVYEYMSRIYGEIWDNIVASFNAGANALNVSGKLYSTKTGRYQAYLPDSLK